MAHNTVDSELCALMGEYELMTWAVEIIEQAKQMEARLLDQEGMDRATIIFMRCRQTETLLAEYASLPRQIDAVGHESDAAHAAGSGVAGRIGCVA